MLSGIGLLEDGETITPTSLAKKVSCHPDTVRKKLESYEKDKKIGFRLIKDKNGFVKLIVKEDNNTFITDQIGKILKELIDIKNDLQLIKSKIKKKA